MPMHHKDPFDRNGTRIIQNLAINQITAQEMTNLYIN
jgi:hypothetical protein